MKKLAELSKDNEQLCVITRAKMNCIAYKEITAPAIRKHGRPRKKGESVKLMDLFESEIDSFINTTATLYGVEEEIRYLCKDLLWGTGLYQKLRFVLVIKGKSKAIFVSTNLTLAPVRIIECYAMRFSIECTFRELKQQIGGFSYRFWTRAIPNFLLYSWIIIKYLIPLPS